MRLAQVGFQTRFHSPTTLGLYCRTGDIAMARMSLPETLNSTGGECHSPAVADVVQAWRRGRGVAFAVQIIDRTIRLLRSKARVIRELLVVVVTAHITLQYAQSPNY